MEKKLTLKYSLLQGAYWMVAATAMAYVTPILEAKGFDSMEIGILNAIKYASVVVFQMLIGGFSDKHATTIPLKRTITFLSIISMIAAGIFWFAEANFLIAAFVFMLFGATVNCVAPIIDSLSIQYMNTGRKINYTVSRAAGSATWAIYCVVLGVIADAWGSNSILLFQIGTTVLMILANLVMDKVDLEKLGIANHQTASVPGGEKPVAADQYCTKEECESECSCIEPIHNSWFLLSHFPKYRLFLLACLLTFAGYNMGGTFMIDVIHKLGGNHTDYGWFQFVTAAAEVPVALFFYWLKSKISVQKLMVVCSAFCTIRAGATALAPNVQTLILVQGFEVFGLAIFYAGSVFFVMQYLPTQDAIKGTSLINLATVGIGEALGSVLSGVINTHMGLQVLMNASVVFSLAAVVVMVVMVRTPAERSVRNRNRGDIRAVA